MHHLLPARAKVAIKGESSHGGPMWRGRAKEALKRLNDPEGIEALSGPGARK